MVIKLLHLSDLHISAFDVNNGIVAQKIEYIRNAYPSHHYVVTGDLVDNEGVLLPGTRVPVNKDDPNLWYSAFASPPPPAGPLQPHLDIARAGMQKAYQLLSRLNLQRVYVMPGNHDHGLWGNLYYREFANAFDEILWRPINGNKSVTQLGVLDAPFVLPSVNSRIPVMFPIPDPSPPPFTVPTTVQLCVMNSNPDSSGSPTFLDMASGTIGGGQINKYQQFVQADLLSPFDPAPIRHQLGIMRVLALHHHPWFSSTAHKIIDADALLGVVRRSTDLIMFGHRHVQTRYAPGSVEAVGLTYGGLASGWIRSENTAAEITVTAASNVQINYVPII